MADLALTRIRAQDELRRRASARLAKLRDTPEYREAVREALRSRLFDRQLAVMDDPAWRISWCCGRRAGKTSGAESIIACALEDSGEEEFVVFGARTLGIARDLIWRKMCRLKDAFSLGWKINQSRNEITTTRGAEFRMFGVDDDKSVDKVRGKKYRLVFCDEASTYQDRLEKLIKDCFSPGTKDFDPPGRIIIAGTPGYVCAGFWYDIAGRPLDEGGNTAFKRHAWTIRDNPFIPNVDAALAEEREAWHWTEDDPVYLREYEGRWINDGDALVYAYSPARNAVRELPVTFDPDTWLTTLSADIGYTDDFALCVLGSPPHSREMFVLYSFKQAGLLVGAQADLIHQARKRFRPTRTVVDAGGQGKMTLEEFNARYGSTAGGRALPADKQGKVEAIGMLNSDFRFGSLKLLLPDARPLESELLQLPWASADKDKEHQYFPNHAADCLLYGWRKHRSFLAQPAPPPKTDEDLERERIDARNEKARQRAMLGA